MQSQLSIASLVGPATRTGRPGFLAGKPEDVQCGSNESNRDVVSTAVTRHRIQVDVFHVAFEECVECVATLLLNTADVLDALDQAYLGTQNIELSWVIHRGQCGVEVRPSTAVLTRGGCRSTSVGDYARVIEAGGQESFWRCVSFGWKLFQGEDARRLVGMAAIEAAYGLERKA